MPCVAQAPKLAVHHTQAGYKAVPQHTTESVPQLRQLLTVLTRQATHATDDNGADPAGQPLIHQLSTHGTAASTTTLDSNNIHSWITIVDSMVAATQLLVEHAACISHAEGVTVQGDDICQVG